MPPPGHMLEGRAGLRTSQDLASSLVTLLLSPSLTLSAAWSSVFLSHCSPSHSSSSCVPLSISVVNVWCPFCSVSDAPSSPCLCPGVMLAGCQPLLVCGPQFLQQCNGRMLYYTSRMHHASLVRALLLPHHLLPGKTQRSLPGCRRGRGRL